MAAAGLSLLGVNLSGAEFGSVGQQYGYGYIYPTTQEVDYYASKGLNTIRLPFKWERLQPTLNGTLNSAELARMDAFVNYATGKGLKVILDPHDFGGYNGQLVGSAAVPNSAFANFWSQLAGHYSANANVMFGLMNEPNQQSATSWLGSENAAIAGIRAAGANQEILVQGSYWDSGSNWTTSDNASVIGTGIVDPKKNFAFEVHQYLDSDNSGTHSTVVSPTIGADRLTAVTQWAESHGAKLFLGEFGAASDPASLTAMNNMLSYMSQHNDVWQGATEWGGGPWWGNYMFSTEPTNGVDKPQIGILDQYIQHAAPVISGSKAGQTSTAQAPLKPFSGVTITDPNSGATETLTIKMSGTGGQLAGNGLSGETSGTYQLAAGSAAQITSELRALIFTPTAGSLNTSVTTSFSLSDLSSVGSNVVDNITTVIDKNTKTAVSRKNAVVASEVSPSSAEPNLAFVFAPGQGQQLVTNFVASGPQHDTLDFTASTFSDLADVLRHTTMANGSADIQFNENDSLILQNVTKASLRAHPHDFVFHV